MLIHGSRSTVGIGIGTKDASLGRLPGWEAHSWGLHGDDGHVYFSGGERGKPYTAPFVLDDTVGCGVNFRTNTLFFTKNGEAIGMYHAQGMLKVTC